MQEGLKAKEGPVEGPNQDYTDASDEEDLLGMIGGGGGAPGKVLRQGSHVDATHVLCFMNIFPKSIKLTFAHFVSLKF